MIMMGMVVEEIVLGMILVVILRMLIGRSINLLSFKRTSMRRIAE